MSLVSLDDSFFDHPKAIEAGEDGANLYVRGLAYCRRYNTDGRIPKAALPKLSTKREAVAAAKSCVRVGLWIEDESAWYVHDYETWYSNDAQAKLAKQRKLAASRAKNYRDSKRDDPPPITPASRDASRDSNVVSAVTVTSPQRDVTRDISSRGRARVPNSDSDVSPLGPPTGGATAQAPADPEPTLSPAELAASATVLPWRQKPPSDPPPPPNGANHG